MNQDNDDGAPGNIEGQTSNASYKALPQESPPKNLNEGQRESGKELEISGRDNKSRFATQANGMGSLLEPLLFENSRQTVEMANFRVDPVRNLTEIPGQTRQPLPRTQSIESFNSQLVSVRNQNAVNLQLKMTQTWFDHFKIIIYNFIEPILLATAMASCLQLPTLSTLLYTLLMFLGMLPLVLSINQTNIKFKQFLCCLMVVVALSLFIFKLVMIIQFNRDPSQFDNESEMWKFLGVFSDQPWATLVIDIFQICICGILIFHLNDQREQATQRLAVIDRLIFQTSIKLYHPYFGSKHKAIFFIAYVMFLIDTFILLTVAQLIVLSTLIVLMLFWERIVNQRHPALAIILRLIQVLCVVQVLIAFFLQLPIVADKWQAKNNRLVHILGVVGTQSERPYKIYARFHYVIVCLAIVATEMYIVSVQIFDLHVKRTSHPVGAVGGQPGPSPSKMGDKKFSSILRDSESYSSQVLPRTNTKNLLISEIKKEEARFQRSQLLTKKTPVTISLKETFWSKIQRWFHSRHASIIIWVCRTLAFFWIYCYHDWQSVILLIWILHSTLYNDSALFKKWMIYFYTPLVTVIFLWYYVTNIFGLIEYTTDPIIRGKQYDWGLYQFQIPPLEISFMFMGLWSFCSFTVLLDTETAEKRFENELIKKIGSRRTSIFYPFLFIFLINIEYPMMLFLVLAGLNKMDIYHVTMLLFFVWYTFNRQVIQRQSIWLLLYANFFVLEKYLFTLIDLNRTTPNWVQIVGFSTEYDPHSTKEYFRYSPKFDQWLLVMLTFCLYRRQAILGTNDSLMFAEYTRKAENQIKLRMPRFYRFCIVVDIFYTNIIVIISFTLYLVLVVVIKSTLINAITQTLVLILLCIYLAKGIKELLGYWNLLTFYQAIVLVVMVVFQFMVQSPGFEDSRINNFFQAMPFWILTLAQWSGFVKYDDHINLKLLPYVIFFSLAIILQTNFKHKQAIERRQLITEEDIKLHKQDSKKLDLVSQDEGDAPDKDAGSPKNKAKENRHSLDEAARMNRDKQLETLMRSDPTSRYEQSESEFVFNYGNISGVTSDTMEILHHKQTMSMKYKISYLTYQLETAWPLLDAIAAYYFIIINVTILAFALYYQLAIFWAIALTIYMGSQFINSHNHYTYREKDRLEFLHKLEQEDHQLAKNRLLQSEEEIIKKMKQNHLENQRRQTEMTDLRQKKLLARQSHSSKRLPNTTLQQSSSFDRVGSVRFGGELAVNTQVERGRSLEAPERQSAIQNGLDDLQTDSQRIRRLKVTDEEVIKEFERFHSEIHQVSLKSRYFAWISLMILLTVGLALIYITSFANLYSSSVSPFEDITKQRLVFLFFWGGVYSDYDSGDYLQSSYPFYILITLLVFERLAQLWIENRFGCNDTLIRKFKLIEKEDLYYRNLAKEKKKALERRFSIRKSRPGGRTTSMGSVGIISSATESVLESSQLSQSEMDDSFAFDSEKRTGMAGSLRTIEEEKKEVDLSQLSNQPSHSERSTARPTNVGATVSINLSYREPQILDAEDADKLIRSGSSADAIAEGLEQELPIVEIVDKEASVEFESWEKRDELKKKLASELKPLLNVNSRLRFYGAIKRLLENFCILLVWFSCIFKQNILSMILFCFLVIYTYKRSGKTLLWVRSTVVVLFVFQYWIEIFNLSYYNSPKSFPKHLVGEGEKIYPDADHYYYKVPFILSWDQTTDASGKLLNSTANLNYWSYLTMDASNRKLNGIWIDFIMTVVVSIYFSLCNFWMLYRPIKVILSKETEKKLRQYSKITRRETGKNSYKSLKHVSRDLKLQFGMSKFSKAWSETIYTTFPIILIAFTLAISIFNQSILSFGYILFVMILAFDNIQFLKKKEGLDRLQITLKYFMLPYLLIDILLQLIYQMPFTVFEAQPDWSRAIGFERVWNITPATLYLGEDTQVVYTSNSCLTTMMLKGVTFFLITIQLQVISSFHYKKFMQMKLENQHVQTQKVGRGITYRFNNFKSKMVLKQAQETQQVEKMLWQVKRLIRRREQLYNNAHKRQDDIRARKDSKLQVLNEMEKIAEKNLEDSQYSSDDEQSYERKFQSRKKAEHALVKKEYEKKLRELSCCNKLYMWIRRNWVVDILFQTSEEQLDDIINQLHSGRTNIKTSVEIGLQLKAKKERQIEIENQINELILEQVKDSQKQKVFTQQVTPEASDEDAAPDKEVIEEEKEPNTQAPEAGVTESREFTKQLNNLFSSIDKSKQEKKILSDLLKSEVYRPSTKPWEIVNISNFLDWQRSFGRYLVVIYKTLVSYSELFCYMMMLLATFMKAGLFYMVYPIAIFGYCILEEQRPGRVFWFCILFYTQGLLILNFVAQLELWEVVFSPQQKIAYNDFFDRNKFGIYKVEGSNFGSTFVFYFPEIFILFTVLVHIQKEMLAGVFDVPYEEYETFEEGLLRYRLEVLCNTEAERAKVTAEFSHYQALNIKISSKEIDPYRERENLSETDKYERSVQMGDPIRRDMTIPFPLSEDRDMLQQIDQIEQRRMVFQQHEVTERESHQDLDAFIIANQQQAPEEDSQRSVQSEDNICQRRKGTEKNKFNFKKLLEWVFYKNSFMERLFPLIKQQKPGKDLYAYVAAIQIFLIIYVFLFYANMQGNESDIATQFSTNQYSSNMVYLVCFMILIIMVDRILYSTHAFLSGVTTTYDQSPNEDLNAISPYKRAQSASLDMTIDESMLSGFPNVRRQSTYQKIEELKSDSKAQNNWIEDQFALSDDSDQNGEDLFTFDKNLVPQKYQASWTRVIKFYWFWFILCISHYFVFFGLVSTISYCKVHPQLDKDSNQLISFGEPNYRCNTFDNNGWIITFYFIICIYLAIQAYQMRIGLPEIRKGSFLMDSFNPVSGVIYRAYLGVPFIFELRTLIDWTFTTTSLDAFQWIKLAQIQNNMFVAKCVNKDYMERPLGKRVQKWEKITIGCGLVFFIVLMIVGPIILFSSLNPISKIDNPTGGILRASLSFSNSTSMTNQTLILFETNQVQQITQITQEQYDLLRFNQNDQTTAQFSPEQIQIMQFSQTSDISWIVSKPAKDQFSTLLNQLVNGTLPKEINIFYTFDFTINREEPEYGPSKGKINPIEITVNNTAMAQSLANQITCQDTNLNTTFPAGIVITQKTDQSQLTTDIKTGDPSLTTDYMLNYHCNTTQDDMTNNYWELLQVFTTNQTVAAEVKVLQTQVFADAGFGFILFQQKVMPGLFAAYSSNLVVFYVTIIYVIATVFRGIFVPRTWEIFIIDAPMTEDILKICQSIHVYRVQHELQKEEELYMILIDIMRSPEMIKALCGSSLKKKLQ